MPEQVNNNICREHSGVIERLKDCERNVSALWCKWDTMQKVTLGIFITLSLNLIGVIILLVRMGLG